MALLSSHRRLRRGRRVKLLVLAGLVCYVGLVYLVIVLGGGYLIGDTGSPNVALSVLATAVVALGFEPVQRRLEKFALEALHGGLPAPYEVLSRFAQTVSGGYSSEELPGRMSKLIAEATGAGVAQVWLVFADESRLAASWPPGDATLSSKTSPSAGAGLAGPWRSVPVRHGGEVLAVLRLQERENDPLTPVEERLVSGLAAQAGLVLRSARLRAELSQRFAELSVRAEELRASRERLITTQDAERRALERDIHDGAQQNLVALAVNLRLADALCERSPQRAVQVMTEQSAAARLAIDTLLRLSRGIYPHLLESDGLVAAITAAAVASSLPVDVIAEDVPRPARPIEAALYFCCLEALQNAAKHSGATRVSVRIDAVEEGSLRLVVSDDGCGFDTEHGPRGVGMANMRDRVDAAGGVLSVESTPGHGAVVTVRVPSGVLAMGVG